MQVSLSSHKSTEFAIKNLEVQVGQLAKQLVEMPTISFGANIEKNPNEECKVIFTRSRMRQNAETKKRDERAMKDVSVLIPIDWEINATCRKRNVERNINFLQDSEVAATPEGPLSSEASSSFPTQGKSHTVAGCLICGGAHESGYYISQEEATREVNYMGNQPRPNFNAGGHSGFQYGQQYHSQQGQWRNHPRNQFNKDQGGPSNRPQQQGPSLYDRTTKLEETFTQFMQVSKSNQKGTESAIKNLEVQVGQLAKQLADRPSSSFGANTEKNPNGECKVVMTRSRLVAMKEGENGIGAEKQQLVSSPALDLVVESLSGSDEELEAEDEKKKETTINLKRHQPQHLRPTMIDRDSHPKRPGIAILTLKILPERNVMIYHTKFDEFKTELERRNWHKELTNFLDESIDVAIVKEFYANLYDPEDKSPKQVRVRDHLIKFDEDALNTFLKMPVIIEEGESLSTYSRFCRLRPDPQELAARLCIPGRGFELNTDGLPLKILRKNLTTLAQT
ncbi:hypothetical protein GmHk_06G017195 [Glycine max]|nr:hypothetical protein GmHk_06G017195 [Glycine max]